MENGHETWNLEGETSLLVRGTRDSCRTVCRTFSGLQEVSWEKRGTE